MNTRIRSHHPFGPFSSSNLHLSSLYYDILLRNTILGRLSLAYEVIQQTMMRVQRFIMVCTRGCGCVYVHPHADGWMIMRMSFKEQLLVLCFYPLCLTALHADPRPCSSSHFLLIPLSSYPCLPCHVLPFVSFCSIHCQVHSGTMLTDSLDDGGHIPMSSSSSSSSSAAPAASSSGSKKKTTRMNRLAPEEIQKLIDSNDPVYISLLLVSFFF